MQFVRDHIAFIIAFVIIIVLALCIHTKWLAWIAGIILGIASAEIDYSLKKENGL